MEWTDRNTCIFLGGDGFRVFLELTWSGAFMDYWGL